MGGEAIAAAAEQRGRTYWSQGSRSKLAFRADGSPSCAQRAARASAPGSPDPSRWPRGAPLTGQATGSSKWPPVRPGRSAAGASGGLFKEGRNRNNVSRETLGKQSSGSQEVPRCKPDGKVRRSPRAMRCVRWAAMCIFPARPCAWICSSFPRRRPAILSVRTACNFTILCIRAPRASEPRGPMRHLRPRCSRLHTGSVSGGTSRWVERDCSAASARREMSRSFADAEAAKNLLQNIFDRNCANQAPQRLRGAAQVFGSQFSLLDPSCQKGAQRGPTAQQLLAMPLLGKGRGLLIADPCRGDRRQLLDQCLKAKSLER